jgi:hypothetical protein
MRSFHGQGRNLTPLAGIGFIATAYAARNRAFYRIGRANNYSAGS